MFPREKFVLASTRPFSEEEQEEARRFFAAKPKRVARAWLLSLGAPPLLFFVCGTLTGVLKLPNDSPAQVSVLFPAFFAPIVAPAIGVCLGMDILLEKRHASLVLSGQTLEVWEPASHLPEEERLDLPLRVEVVSRTYEIWNIEYDEGEEDHSND